MNNFDLTDNLAYYNSIVSVFPDGLNWVTESIMKQDIWNSIYYFDIAYLWIFQVSCQKVFPFVVRFLSWYLGYEHSMFWLHI